MKNYKAMKTAKNWSVKKVKVVEAEAVKEVKDDKGVVVRMAQVEQSRNELQLVKKRFDGSTGKAIDDSVHSYSLEQVANEISRMKASIVAMQAEQADMEEMEKDLKAL
jgi:hypothetical protein